MSIDTEAIPRWYRHDYLRMVSAEVRSGRLVVAFADGTQAQLDVRCLLPQAAAPDWERLSFDTYEITVPIQGETFEIPSSRIRALSDAPFDEHLAGKAAEQQRLIGERIREMRCQRQLGIVGLAARADVTPETLTQIEQGEREVDFGALQRILAAMGGTMRDLVVGG